MYESDSGIEELLRRLGPPEGVVEDVDPAEVPDFYISVEWLAEQMRLFVDEHPDLEEAVGALGSYLAHSDDLVD